MGATGFLSAHRACEGSVGLSQGLIATVGLAGHQHLAALCHWALERGLRGVDKAPSAGSPVCFSLTMSIVLGLILVQVWIASSFFLQPKVGAADKQKPLALNNR